MTVEKTVDCFKCQYRQDIPNDTHSRCAHPSLEQEKSQPLAEFAELMAQAGALGGVVTMVHFHVVQHPHGVMKGWCTHPFNFDPIWIMECDGFLAKEEPEEPSPETL